MNKEDNTPPPQKKKFTFDRNAKGFVNFCP